MAPNDGMTDGADRRAGGLAEGAQGLRIAFIHPDLGLGGAERLIVDAATELVRAGHAVDVYTPYYDPARCFEETKTGGFAVRTAGGWFPRHVLGRMLALCAYARCVLVALHIAWRVWTRGTAPYDVIIADQVSAVVPVLKALLPSTAVLFYCHFPDMLLARRESAIKRLYRAPLDWLEQATTGAADLVLVNSRFTRGVFADTFTRLAARGLQPSVLYPAVQLPSAAELRAAEAAWRTELDPELAEFVGGGVTFLSINRFERKKGIGLALEALHELLLMRVGRRHDGGAARGGAAAAGKSEPRLVIAGGYDPRIAENVEHLAELRAAADAMDLRHLVRFVPSFTDRQRTLLLAACRAVLYTPQAEHFGIVPLEAMAAERPVVAVRSGGPTESVLHGRTGMLCEPAAAEFAAAMAALTEPVAAAAMGAAARAHVEASFSRTAFGRQLDGYVRGLAAAAGRQERGEGGRAVDRVAQEAKKDL